MSRKTGGRGSMPLSRERVLRAAVRLADETGIEALSMRNLAEALGVKAMSLYNHVTGKDAVLDGIVDLVVGEIELPARGADWKPAMRRRAVSAHEVLMRRPWATRLIVSRINVGPAMLRYMEATLACLREAAFSAVEADHAWNAIDSYVYGFTLQKLNFPFQPSEYADAAKRFLPLIPPGQYPCTHELAQQVIDGRHDGLNELGFGLDLILDGLDRLRRDCREAAMPPRE